MNWGNIMDKFKELTSQVDNHIDEIIELEQELVKIESVNTGSMPTGNETEACEYIRAVSYTHLTLPTIYSV